MTDYKTALLIAAAIATTSAQFPEAKKLLRRALEAGPQASSAPTLASIEMWSDGNLGAAKSTLEKVSDKQRTAQRTIAVQFWYALLSGRSTSKRRRRIRGSRGLSRTFFFASAKAPKRVPVIPSYLRRFPGRGDSATTMTCGCFNRSRRTFFSVSAATR